MPWVLGKLNLIRSCISSFGLELIPGKLVPLGASLKNEMSCSF